MHKTASLQQLLEDRIKELHFPASPNDLYDPLRYFMTLGGKRTRPMLTLLGCELFGQPGEKALNAALAIELFHNFTLIHDDIMDQAPLRRGNPTVHAKWNVNVGILSGDVLFVKAFERLADNPSEYLPDLIEVFTRTATEVCEGQQLDMDFESREDVSIPEYIDMIRLKTSVLLGAALEMGAIVGDASPRNKQLIYDFGVHTGIAFQLQDDLLDLFADPDKFGKQVGGDILANKKTFLLIKAKELAASNALYASSFQAMLNEKDATRKVELAQRLFEQMGVRELARKEMERYNQLALAAIHEIDVPHEQKVDLLSLAQFLMNRDV